MAQKIQRLGPDGTPYASDQSGQKIQRYDADGQAVIASPFRRNKLNAARTYYVLTTGSDTNSGLVNSSGGAFLTIQQAINVASALDNGGFDITIQIGNGTYTGANTLKSFVGSGKIIIVGDETTPANVLISTTSANCFAYSAGPGAYAIRGMKLQTTTSGGGVIVSGGAVVYIKNLTFGAMSGSYHMQASELGFIGIEGNYNITGGSYAHLNTSGAAVIDYTAACTATLTGTPAFTYFALADRFSIITTSVVPTYSGAATGTRYVVQLNSVLYTGSSGANFFPGNAAGSAATGGQYS